MKHLYIVFVVSETQPKSSSQTSLKEEKCVRDYLKPIIYFYMKFHYHSFVLPKLNRTDIKSNETSYGIRAYGLEMSSDFMVM